MMRTVKEFANYANDATNELFSENILDCENVKETLKEIFTYRHYGIDDHAKFYKELKEDQEAGYLKTWIWYDQPGAPAGYIPTIKGINEIYKYLRNPGSFTIEPFSFQVEEEKKRIQEAPPAEVYKYKATSTLQMAQFVQRVLHMGYKQVESFDEYNGAHIVLRKGATQVEIFLPRENY